MKRTVIQLVAGPSHQGGSELWALCNDGTMWELNAGHWVQMPEIPQPNDNDEIAKGK